MKADRSEAPRPRPPIACPRCRRHHVVETLREAFGLSFRCEECGFFWAISRRHGGSRQPEPEGRVQGVE
jgi:hypothetical protein